MNILEKRKGIYREKWFQKTMSLLMRAAMSATTSGSRLATQSNNRPPSSWVPYDNEQHTGSVTAYQTWVCSYCDAMGQMYQDTETRYERHYHVHVMTVKMTVDGVEQTYYFGLRLDEFGLWQMIELAENEVGEDTLVQK